MTDVTPFLWFDDDGEAAILFYTDADSRLRGGLDRALPR